MSASATLSARHHSKLSGKERRAAIIKAVRRVFAEKGFHGTTTRELAEAAGVSEALLFKHFPNKEALYSAMQVSCCGQHDPDGAQRIAAMEPSAATLVYLVHLLVSHIVGRKPSADDEGMLHTRLMLRSLTEDGEFARLFLRGDPAQAGRKLQDCIKAAVAAGDAIDAPVRPAVAGWFAQSLAGMIRLHLLPATPVVDYGLSREKLVEQAAWFILRGMGLKEQVIKRHYDTKTFTKFGNG
jgi:AcrR family transcriptional regulator